MHETHTGSFHLHTYEPMNSRISENNFCRQKEEVPKNATGFYQPVYETHSSNCVLSWNTAFCIAQFIRCMKLVWLHLMPRGECVTFDCIFTFSLHWQITCCIPLIYNTVKFTVQLLWQFSSVFPNLFLKIFIYLFDYFLIMHLTGPCPHSYANS